MLHQPDTETETRHEHGARLRRHLPAQPPRTDLIETHVLDLPLVRRQLQRIVETGQSAVDVALEGETEALAGNGFDSEELVNSLTFKLKILAEAGRLI